MIKENIEKIVENIENIKGKSIEDAGITIVAASKMQDHAKIQEAINSGIRDLGENKVQEFETKYDDFKDYVHFHQIGSLQSNKAKDVVGKVRLIHSLDRKSLLEELDKRAMNLNIIQDCLIQVNVSKEESKSGIYLENLDEFLDLVEDYDNIRVKGLMTMAPHYDDPEDSRWVFEKLKNVFDEISAINYNNISMEYLSMGMTNDYKVALESGSNMIRLGSEIFGERNY